MFLKSFPSVAPRWGSGEYKTAQRQINRRREGGPDVRRGGKFILDSLMGGVRPRNSHDVCAEKPGVGVPVTKIDGVKGRDLARVKNLQ